MRSQLLSSSFFSSFVLVAATALGACSAADSGTSSPIARHSGTGSDTGAGTGSGTGSGTGTGAGTGTGSGSGNGATGGGSGSGSGAGTGSASGGATISADTTWKDGDAVSGSVTIATGVTVTIAPGAKVNVASGATITVQGTLKASANATHAKLTSASWGGVVVASGGTLTADSLDIENASTGLDVAGTATWNNGVISGATTPFKVEKGGALTTDHSSVTGTKGMSLMNGSFTATHLDYDSGGAEGIQMSDPSATFSAEDSIFHGTDVNGGDMIRASAVKSVHLLHDEIKNCHCAHHFDGVQSFDISYMNVHDVSYGFMMYGSDPNTGTRTVTNSNFQTLSGPGISESGTNGPISVTGCYFDASAKLQLSDQEVTVSSPASGVVPGTGPRQ